MTEIQITPAGLNDRAFIRSVSERTWPSTYGHIISQEQIDFMLDWMYSDASLEKQMNTGCEFYIASNQNDHGDIEPVGFCSVSPEDNKAEVGNNAKAHKLNKLYVLPAAQGPAPRGVDAPGLRHDGGGVVDAAAPVDARQHRGKSGGGRGRACLAGGGMSSS